MIQIDKEKFSKEILNRLSKLQELPKNGFLCGGAVSNTILSIIDGKDYPINDLDIFTFDVNQSYSNAPLRTVFEVDIAADRYESRILIPSMGRCNYRIIKTSYDGIINYVYVFLNELSGTDLTEKEKYNIILDSFDINCCKAGINLSNGDLYLNEDFLDFIRTRQLLCVNPITPAHSIIRLLKKRDDLNAYLNKEESFKYLSQFFLYDKNIIHKDRNISIFFGVKYKELFHRYEKEINDYFSLWSYAKIRKFYHNLNKIEFEKNSQFYSSEIDSTVSVPNWVYFNSIRPESMTKWYEIKLWSLVPKKFSSLDEEIKKYYKPEFGVSPMIIKRLWDLLYNQNKKQKNKSVKLLETKEFYPFVIANDNFHDCDFSDINIEKLAKFMGENPNFGKMISLTKLNFQESEKLMNMVKKLFPEELNLFCELISKELEDEKYFKPYFDNKKILDPEYITNKYTMVKSILSKELTKKIDLSEFEYKNIIKELVSPLDLMWGGNFMHNCLRGYNENGFNHRIERDEIKIFIISDEHERTALQISKTYSNTYKIDQIYGHSNNPVCIKHKMVADYLISFLEYKHYLLESERIINNFKNNRLNFIEEINSSSYERYEKNKKLNNIFNDLIGHDTLFEPVPIVDLPQLIGMTVNELDDRDVVNYQNDDYEEYDDTY